LFDNASSIEKRGTSDPCGPEKRCRSSLCSYDAITLASADLDRGYIGNALKYWYERNRLILCSY